MTIQEVITEMKEKARNLRAVPLQTESYIDIRDSFVAQIEEWASELEAANEDVKEILRGEDN